MGRSEAASGEDLEERMKTVALIGMSPLGPVGQVDLEDLVGEEDLTAPKQTSTDGEQERRPDPGSSARREVAGAEPSEKLKRRR